MKEFDTQEKMTEETDDIYKKERRKTFISLGILGVVLLLFLLLGAGTALLIWNRAALPLYYVKYAVSGAPEYEDRNYNGLCDAEENALKELIKQQRERGADVSNNLYSLQYVWKDGYLEEIEWKNKGLSGEISFQMFPHLSFLRCDDNSLTKVDLAKHPRIGIARLNNNNITSADFSGSTVTYVYLDDNELTEIRLDGCNKLKTLSCNGNRIEYLDLLDKPQLQELECANNSLKTLLCYSKSELTYLNCENNDLETLDLSGCIGMEWLDCENNPIKELDVSHMKRLERLVATVPRIDLSENTKLTSITLTGLDTEELDLGNCSEAEWITLDSSRADRVLFGKKEALTNLTMTKCNIREFDLSGMPNLEVLNCSESGIKELDLHANMKLKELYCQYNNLKRLDVKANRELTDLACFENPLSVVYLPADAKLEKHKVIADPGVVLNWN